MDNAVRAPLEGPPGGEIGAPAGLKPPSPVATAAGEGCGDEYPGPALAPAAADLAEAAGEPTGANGQASDDAGAGDGAALASLKDALAAQEEALTDLQQRYLRLQADFDNYRKRARREQEEMTRLAGARLISGLLPVIDNLERALAAAGEAEKETLAAGVEMTWRHLMTTLAEEGLQPVAALGQPFNPALHEAVAREETAAPEKVNLVVEELRRGYTLHGKLLRPAMVKVAVAAAAGAPQDAPEKENRG